MSRDADGPKRAGMSTGSKAGLGCGGCSLVFILLLAVLWHEAMITPEVVIPTPKMPSPNAFTYFDRAGNLIVVNKQIDSAKAAQYAQLPLTVKDKYIAANAPALQTLRQGFAYEYRSPPARSFYTLFPYYARFRDLARLLRVKGDVQATQGDWGGAVDSNLDTIQMGEMIPHGSVLIGELVGIACQAIGRRDIWKDVEHLNAVQARQAARRLERIMGLHTQYAETLQEEKWCGQAGLLELFRDPRGPGAQIAPQDANADDDVAANAQAKLSRLMYLIYSKRRIMANYSGYIDRQIARARQPYNAQVPEIPIPNDPITQILSPVFSQTRLKDVNGSLTQNGLLLVTLALHAYHEEHGAYPDTLTALVPSYLNKLPNDPFASEGTFQYRRLGAKYVLYSIGPDRKDDGGKPIDKPSASTSNSVARYYVDPNSQGDIVAGTNIY